MQILPDLPFRKCTVFMKKLRERRNVSFHGLQKTGQRSCQWTCCLKMRRLRWSGVDRWSQGLWSSSGQRLCGEILIICLWICHREREMFRWPYSSHFRSMGSWSWHLLRIWSKWSWKRRMVWQSRWIFRCLALLKIIVIFSVQTAEKRSTFSEKAILMRSLRNWKCRFLAGCR